MLLQKKEKKRKKLFSRIIMGVVQVMKLCLIYSGKKLLGSQGRSHQRKNN